jgi:catalase
MPATRERMVSHLINIDQDLAKTVAEGLGLPKLPKGAAPAVEVKKNLAPSDALSILKNPLASFKGRKLGVLMTDGVDAALLTALERAAKKEGATVERVAPAVGGVTADDGTRIPAHHKIDGGPSVLFDAVAILASESGVKALLKLPPARDFVADAYAHYKFVAFTPAAVALFTKAGLPGELDQGFVKLDKKADADAFVMACRDLRFWERPDGA